MFCLQLLAPSPQLGRESQMVEFHEQHGLISSADDTIEPHANRPVEDLAMQTFSVQCFGAPTKLSCVEFKGGREGRGREAK